MHDDEGKKAQGLEFSFLRGGGEMGERIRSFDWSKSPLGAPGTWPQSLRTTVRFALNTNHPVFIFWGDEHTCLYNDAYMHTLGSERHPSALGARGREVWAEIWPLIGPQIDMVMAGEGGTWHEGQRIPLTRNGRVENIWWTYSYSPIDDDGRQTGVGGVLVLTSDVSEQFRLSEQLNTEKSRLRDLFLQAPSAIAILAGPKHIFELANEAYLALVDKRHLVGKPIRQVVPEFVRSGLAERLDRAYATGEPFHDRGLPVVVGGDADREDQTRYVDLVCQPIREADGSISGIFVQGHDVTDQKQSEHQLRQAHDATRAILENVEEGVFGIDGEGRIAVVNPAALAILGFAPEDLLGKNGHWILHHHHADGRPYHEAECPLFLTTQDGKTRRVEGEVFFRKDGSSFPVEYTCSAIRDRRSAKDLAYVMSFRDVTEKVIETILAELAATVLGAVSEGRPLREILTEIALGLNRLLPDLRASISLAVDGRLYTMAAPGLPEAFIREIDGIEIADGVGACGTAAARGEQVICRDIGSDPKWSGYQELAADLGLKSCWSTPVMDGEEQVLATFSLYGSSSAAPTASALAIIERVSRYVVLAIERTRERDRLAESEAHYRSVYDLVPVLIWEEDWCAVKPMLLALRDKGVIDYAAYFLNNPDFVDTAIQKVKVLSVNRTGAEMFGASSSKELLDAKDAVIENPESKRLFRLAMSAFMEGRREFEAECTTNDIHGNRLFLYVRMALPPLDGAETRVILSQMDITELRQVNERLSVVVNATSDVIWDYDMVSGRVWCSDGLKTMFGLDPEDFKTGRTSWSDHLHPDEYERIWAEQKMRVDGDASGWRAEYRFLRADGRYADIRDQGSILRDRTGKAVRMIGSMVDVTQQKRVEEQLRQSQRLEAVGRLTGGIAHDFNNLLTVILGNAETLMDSLEDRPGVRRLAEMSATAAERGAELTGRLLAFARKQPLAPQITNVNILIASMEDLLRRTLSETIDIRLALADALWMADIDPGQLEVALLNLAINARDAMPDGGHLTIETANMFIEDSYADDHETVVPGRYVMISVSDTGTGMTPDVLKRAFEPFFTTKDVGKGSGLGLSLVYGFVKQSSGHIKIYSEVDIGTVVKMYFPRNADHGEATTVESDSMTMPGGSEHILVVEDDPMVRDHLVAQLQTLGYRVSSAMAGAEAMDIIRRQGDIDVLFTDVVMPGGMNGRELALAAAALQPDMKILFTSGYSENAITHHGRLDQGVHLLGKPYRRQDLAAKLRAVIDE